MFLGKISPPSPIIFWNQPEKKVFWGQRADWDSLDFVYNTPILCQFIFPKERTHWARFQKFGYFLRKNASPPPHPTVYKNT